MTLLYLGLVNWLVTLVLVESELFRPVREFVSRRQWHAAYAELRTFELWSKTLYLVQCQLCTGVWVGLLLAAAQPGFRPLGHGALGFIFAGLAIKAVGHITLEFTSSLQRLGAHP